MHVKDVLARKGTSVATIAPDSTVADLISHLVRYRVGALVVSRDGRLIEGIVSERDVVRAMDAVGAALLDAPVSTIMTADVHTCTPQDEIRSLAITMTDKRFRHMPVQVNEELAGIVSIGDIVKSRLDELEAEHDQLLEYISSTG